MIEAITTDCGKNIDDIKSVLEKCEFDISFSEPGYNVIVYENKVPIATGKIKCNERCEIEYVYVIKEFRHQGFGDLVIRMLIDKAFRLSYKEVECSTKISDVFDDRIFRKIGFEYKKEDVLFINEEMVRRCRH